MGTLDRRGAWTAFKVVDATGKEFLNTCSYADHEPHYRKHVTVWKRYVKTKDYERTVPWYRQPTMPCHIVVEPLE